MTCLTKFVAHLSALSTPNSFNPYTDRCDVFDYHNAPKERRSIFESVLESACNVGVDSLWVGRDLGYRGGRRTGLALTDEAHVEAHLRRWGLETHSLSAFRGSAQSERTASVVWGMLDQINSNVFLWNVFPLHPYVAGNPFTNRAHSAHERRLGEEVLSELIRIIRPSQIVAIGQDAAKSAIRCAGVRDTIALRHPSYGGLREFQRGVRNAFSLVE